MPYGTYGIDFVISGHNHHYQRLVKADGGKTVRYFIDGYGGTDAANHSECGTNTSSATSEALPGRRSRRHEDHRIGHVDHVRSTITAPAPVQNTYTQVIGPEITTSVSSLSPFSTPPGTPSAAQTYTVSGSNLTADISITAPAGFELSTERQHLLFQPDPDPIRRLGCNHDHLCPPDRRTEGSFSGNIAHTSTGAATQNVAVSGTVSNCTTVNLVAAEDTIPEC